MNMSLAEGTPPGLAGDLDVVSFVLAELEAGRRAALVTIVDLDGPFSRPLGAQLGVSQDRRFVGSISGGCLETALTEEALRLIADGRNTVLRYGRGSPYVDVRLPCGGGISLHVNVRPDPDVLRQALERGRRREPFGLAFRTDAPQAELRLLPAEETPVTGEFFRAFAPRLRILLAGRGWELVAMTRLARLWDSEIVVVSQEAATLEHCRPQADKLIQLTTPTNTPQLPLDRHTAMACLFHEHEWEAPLLLDALRSRAFYVGALGSRQTQANRIDALRELGAGPDDVSRLKSPIGLFPALDPRGLALSALAEIVAAYNLELRAS
jgi:xanthine dehydrogenase accessory factor